MTIQKNSYHANEAGGFAKSDQSKWYENTLMFFLALSAGVIFLDRLGIIFVFPQIQHDLRLDHAQLGMLMGATALTWAVSSIVVSFISDALGGGAKIIIVVCLVGFSCATGSIAITTSFASLLAVRAIAGMFFGPAAPLIFSVAAKSSSPHRIGANVGAVDAGMVLFGYAVPPVLITLLASKFGWHMAFFYLALPDLLLAAILGFLIRPKSQMKTEVESVHERIRMRDMFKLLANHNLVLAILCGLPLIGFIITFPSFSPLFLRQDEAMSPALRMTLLAAMGICYGVGSFFVPMLSDRFSRKTCALLAAGCIALSPLLLVMISGHNIAIPLVLIAQFIAGGALPIVVFIIPGESLPSRVAATAFALPLSIGELLGGSSMPGIAGALADHYGLTSVMWFCCCLGLLCFAAIAAMREPPRRNDMAKESPRLKLDQESPVV